MARLILCGECRTEARAASPNHHRPIVHPSHGIAFPLGNERPSTGLLSACRSTPRLLQGLIAQRFRIGWQSSCLDVATRSPAQRRRPRQQFRITRRQRERAASDRTLTMLTNPHRLTQPPASRGSRPHRAPRLRCMHGADASSPRHAAPRHARRDHTHRRARRLAASGHPAHADRHRGGHPTGHCGGHGRWPFDACAACGPPHRRARAITHRSGQLPAANRSESTE